ncbi:hypothetical protein ACFXJ8_07400 [Nonomuraea sp. NPDC059194]|uniref:hypothetical protein n=1 Tax=Nonomuraea sp. NPDC059194 TaxID=3346764 RepID=UPI0036BCE4D9
MRDPPSEGAGARPGGINPLPAGFSPFIMVIMFRYVLQLTPAAAGALGRAAMLRDGLER